MIIFKELLNGLLNFFLEKGYSHVLQIDPKFVVILLSQFPGIRVTHTPPYGS